MRALAGAKLLEREAELDALVAALEQARAGVGGLVVVEGAAGIGKTRLLQAARETAERTGMRALRSRGSELERDFPFALVRQLFEPALMSVEPADREQLLAGAARLAGPVVGLESEETPGDAGGLLVDPSFATLNALYWLTSNLAEARPVLLAVDDAHWADQPSLRFFGFLFARLEDLPVLLALGTRPSERGAGSELLAQLTSDPAARIVRPRALSRDAVAGLVREGLAADAHDEFCAACHEATAGNPFMLRELIRELAADGSSGAAGEAPRVREVAPATIQRAVLVRLGRLPGPAARLAQAVAVLGDDAEPHQAAELAGIDRGAAAEAADALAVAGILEPGRRWCFIHPLVRNAVYADQPGAERRAAHAAAAKLLEDEGAEPERIAVHLLATDPDGNPEVVATLARAAQRALDRAAPEAAIAYLRRALAERPDAGAHRDLLLQLTTASFRAGDPGALTAVDTAVLDQLTAEPQVLMASAEQVAVWLSSVGRVQEAGGVLERAAAAAIEVGDYDLALRFESAIIVWTHASLPQTQAVLDRYEERVAPGTPGERWLLALQAFANALGGEPAAHSAPLARRALADGKIFGEALDRVESATPAMAIQVLVRADELDAAQHGIDQYAAEAHARGAVGPSGAAAFMRAELAYWRGEIARAEPDAWVAAETARQTSLLMLFPGWLGILIDVLVERGELETAQAELEASGMSTEIPDDTWFAPFLHSRGCLRLAQGRMGEGLADLREVGALAQRHGISQSVWSPTGAVAARALAALGQHGPARGLADLYLQGARAWGTARVIGVGLHAVGVVEGGERGVELMREAVATLEDSPARLELARALTDLGAALRRANRRAEAREPLRSALDMARAGGALAVARRAHEELQATGEKLRPLIASGIESLTPSERRVAGMAAEGHSNREIAQALFLTVKTVEAHLSHVYRKLDIRSRSELPATLASGQ